MAVQSKKLPRRSGAELNTDSSAEREVQNIKESVNLESVNITNNIIEQWNGLGELTDRYIENGLVYMSAAPEISKRDNNGNIILYELSENSEKTNQKLYIEPTITYYSNRSFRKNVDTNFSYFTFPPIINVVDTSNTIDLSQDIEDLQLELFNAKFVPSSAESRYTMPRNFQKINFEVPLLGTTQSEPSTYLITPELIETGKDLQFQAKISVHNSNPAGTINEAGRLANMVFRSKFELRAQEYRSTPSNVPESRVVVSPSGYDVLEIVYTIPNSEMVAYDKWQVIGECDATNTGEYQQDQTFWDVQLVEPNTGRIPYGRQVSIETPIDVVEFANNFVNYFQTNRETLLSSDITTNDIITGKLQEKIITILQSYLDLNYPNTQLTVENIFSYFEQQAIQSYVELQTFINSITETYNIGVTDVALGPIWLLYKTS